MPPTIYDFIKEEEAAYELPVTVVDGYDWSMKQHIRTTILYKNSQFTTGKDDNKPFKNIIRPILNLQYRAEGFDVKDIELFVNSQDEYYKSFLIRKYHDKWARENGMDTFIDELVESYVDFGGALVKKTTAARPEVVPLQSVVFADQTDLLSGAFALKHYYNPDQLLEMADRGWGKESNGATATLEDTVFLSQNSKSVGNKETATPSKYIEVYEVHGVLPESYLKADGDPHKYVAQMQICTFYMNEKDERQWITLFALPEKKPIFKTILRDKIYGRALGFGGAEELFEAQVWINYDEIRIKEMLDEAARVVYKTTDEKFAARNSTRNMATGDILVLEEGKDISQVDNFPRTLSVFDRNVQSWEQHAQMMGAANDAIMGKAPTAGTPFKLQELVTAESHSLHEYRKGKLATFIDEIYQDWVIPHIVNELSDGAEFLAELAYDELVAVADQIVVNSVNRAIKERVLDGELPPTDEERDSFIAKEKERFLAGGQKRFIKIMKDEFKTSKIGVYANIAGKQKDVSERTDKLVNIFRQLISAPQVLDDPRMAKIFNEILESSGLSPIMYAAPKKAAQPMQVPQQNQPAAPVLE